MMTSSSSFIWILLLIIFVYVHAIQDVDFDNKNEKLDENTEQSISKLRMTMEQAVQWIEQQGIYGPIYYTLFLALWIVMLLPCTLLEMVPGYLFGFTTGTIVSLIGKTLGTTLSILIGRYLLRDLIQERLFAKYHMLSAFEKAIKIGGFKTILAIRFAYLPMLIKNYGLACLDVSFTLVNIASFISALPFAILWNYIGAGAKNLEEIMSGKLTMKDSLPDDYEYYIPLVVLVGAGAIYTMYRFMQDFRKLLNDIEKKQKN